MSAIEDSLTLEDMAAEAGVDPRTIQTYRARGAFPVYGTRPTLVRRVDAEAWYKSRGIVPKRIDHINGNGNGVSEQEQIKRLQALLDKKNAESNGHPETNGHAEVVEYRQPELVSTGDPQKDIDAIICQIKNEKDINNVKLLKAKADALKVTVDVRKKQKDEGQYVSVKEVEEMLTKLSQQVRSKYMTIEDGFLSAIDGMTPPQIHHELRLRLDKYGKSLTELEWKELNVA